MNKTLTSLIAAVIIVLPNLNYNKAEACTGAKQSAMGDTGITIADNANAVYWNQGMIPFLEKPEVSFVKRFGDDDKFRYDDVVNFSTPIGKNYGTGIQYINSDSSITNEYGKRTEKWQWVKLSAGVGMENGYKWKIGIGMAVTPKIMEDKTEYNPKYADGKTEEKKKNGIDIEASMIAKKQDIIIKGDTFRTGALLRSFDSTEGRGSEGLRPEVSYTLPDKLGDLTIAAGYYGLIFNKKNGENENQGARLGLEQKLGKNLALRTGYTEFKDMNDISAGIGYENNRFGLDAAWSKEGRCLAEITVKF